VLMLRRGKYDGFNDQHFTAKLVEVEGIEVTRETVRRILRSAGVGSPRKRRPPKHRQRPERKAHAGQMILWDGSDHDWLEGRGSRLCLMGVIDDATGEVLPGAHFTEQESTVGYLPRIAGHSQGKRDSSNRLRRSPQQPEAQRQALDTRRRASRQASQRRSGACWPT